MTGSTKDDPLSVSALTEGVKAALEGRYSKIYVEGEISGWRVYPSGHAYFTLKDAGATVSAVLFKSALERCRSRAALRDGAKILVYANLGVYAPRGNYQLVVLAAKPVGEGDLMQRYLDLKRRLSEEGLFDEAKKRPLPFLPRRIGLITSPAGAVVHDMCRVLMRRFPALEVRLFPASVQGDDAPRSLIEGLRHFNAPDAPWRADLLIIGRGGGSFEDLFCFNDEALVRAVASSAVPVISAVGHETDFTLCDFAADRRASTPSVAAELAVPILSDLRATLGTLSRRATAALRGRYQFNAQRADHLGDRLALALRARAATAVRTLGETRRRLDSSLRFSFEKASARLASAGSALDLLSPYAVLRRGYSLTTDEAGRIVRDASALAPGARMRTRFGRGEATAVVEALRADDNLSIT